MQHTYTYIYGEKKIIYLLVFELIPQVLEALAFHLLVTEAKRIHFFVTNTKEWNYTL